MNERIMHVRLVTIESEMQQCLERSEGAMKRFGELLLQVRDQQLYVAYGTFERYAQERWHVTVRRVQQLINHTLTCHEIQEQPQRIATHQGGNATQGPCNESQTRPLHALSPEQKAEAWQKAVDNANGEQPTREQVKAAVAEVTQTTASEPPETVAPPSAGPQGNLLLSAKTGTARDVADMVVELVTGNDDPDTVFLHELQALRRHNCVGKGTKAAIDAALAILSRHSSPSPVQVAAATAVPAPSNNGTPATAAV